MLSVAAVVAWFSAYWARIAIGLLVTAVIAEQLNYQRKSKGLDGPRFVVPFIGGIVAMVLNPYGFWHAHFDTCKLTWNALVGNFMVIATDAGQVRQIFEKTSADFHLVLHPNGYKLLGTNNMAYMNGPYHKELRAQLLPLFTHKALGIYLTHQEAFIKQYIEQWIAEAKNINQKDGMSMKERLWEMNCNTSMTVFIGPYLTEETRAQFRYDYRRITDGFLSFPLSFPGSGLWKGMQSRKTLIALLTQVARDSKARMRSGAEPSCLLDFWMVGTVATIAAAERDGVTEEPAHSSDYDVACITLDFLFASQDASTSSLTWCIDLLSRHPDVLEQVRQEQAQMRPTGNEPFTTDSLAQMKYLNQVMREVLRCRPPATIVPHLAESPYKVSDTYTAPAGSIVVPSIWSSNHSGYSNARAFDPDRFSAERAEDKKYERNFLTFGCGPHVCMGQRYAMNHIMCFIALFATECDFDRRRSKQADEIAYAPTIYPADWCILDSLTARTA